MASLQTTAPQRGVPDPRDYNPKMYVVQRYRAGIFLGKRKEAESAPRQFKVLIKSTTKSVFRSSEVFVQAGDSSCQLSAHFDPARSQAKKPHRSQKEYPRTSMGYCQWATTSFHELGHTMSRNRRGPSNDYDQLRTRVGYRA